MTEPRDGGACGATAAPINRTGPLRCDLPAGHEPAEWHETIGAGDHPVRWMAGGTPTVVGRPPRSWSLPPEPPEDVRAVRDREGFVWQRQDAKVWRRSTGAWTDDILRIVVELGPLTEVVDSDDR